MNVKKLEWFSKNGKYKITGRIYKDNVFCETHVDMWMLDKQGKWSHLSIRKAPGYVLKEFNKMLDRVAAVRKEFEGR